MKWLRTNRLFKAEELQTRERDIKAARTVNALFGFHSEANKGINQFPQKMSKYVFNYQVTKSGKPKVVLLNHQEPNNWWGPTALQ